MQSAEFFRQLQSFSVRYLRKLGFLNQESPWCGKSYHRGEPRGVVIHYTADDSFQRVLRWFLEKRYRARASAHWVIAPGKMLGTMQLCQDLPLVAELPATVVQCVPMDRVAWHATWVNQMTFGVELLNIGELRWQEDQLVSWRPRDKSSPEWTMPWTPNGGVSTQLYGRRWLPYAVPQLVSLIRLLRYAQDQCGAFQQPWVIGHEQVQGVATVGARGHDKRDPGPHFPIWEVRESLLSRGDPSELEWLAAYRSDLGYGMTQRELFAAEWVQSLYPEMNVEPAFGWTQFQKAAKGLSQVGDFGGLGKLALKLLGYHVSDVRTNLIQQVDKESIKLFQKLMGLERDGIAGPITMAALTARLIDRGILRED